MDIPIFCGMFPLYLYDLHTIRETHFENYNAESNLSQISIGLCDLENSKPSYTKACNRMLRLLECASFMVNIAAMWPLIRSVVGLKRS